MKKIAMPVIMVAMFGLVLTSPVAAAEPATGAQLIQSKGCRGCHQLGGSGGSLGPALDKVGGRLPADKIRQILQNPKSRNPSSIMPSFAHLPAEEIKTLVDYLAGLK
jgi:mono/diheme cytochrome c family protein